MSEISKPTFSKFYKVFLLVWAIMLIILLGISYGLDNKIPNNEIAQKIFDASRSPILVMIFGIPIIFFFSLLMKIAEKVINRF